MVTALTNLGPDTFPIRGGWRIVRPDGTSRVVLRRLDIAQERYAVFSGSSTDLAREPRLGYSGSWLPLEDALEFARIHEGDV